MRDASAASIGRTLATTLRLGRTGAGGFRRTARPPRVSHAGRASGPHRSKPRDVSRILGRVRWIGAGGFRRTARLRRRAGSTNGPHRSKPREVPAVDFSDLNGSSGWLGSRSLSRASRARVEGSETTERHGNRRLRQAQPTATPSAGRLNERPSRPRPPAGSGSGSGPPRRWPRSRTRSPPPTRRSGQATTAPAGRPSPPGCLPTRSGSTPRR